VRSPFIGRGFALILIAGLLAWSAVRSIGARPPAAPRLPFPKPAVDEPLAGVKARKLQYSREDAFGVLRPCSNIWEE
jgi:hypothetical protein